MESLEKTCKGLATAQAHSLITELQRLRKENDQLQRKLEERDSTIYILRTTTHIQAKRLYGVRNDPPILGED